MPSIDISRTHDKSMADAKKAVDRVAKSIAKKFDVEHEWDGNALNFERAGVAGRIVISKGRVQVQADISFLLIALKSTIEQEIKRYLDKEFG
jgi:putative polyhydroxyalkanoate system protein